MENYFNILVNEYFFLHSINIIVVINKCDVYENENDDDDDEEENCYVHVSLFRLFRELKLTKY